jgi:hypothetical protein
MLPAPNVRFSPKRKAEIARALISGELSINDAIETYRTSEDELDSWVARLLSVGLPGLRTTRLQQYRAV